MSSTKIGILTPLLQFLTSKSVRIILKHVQGISIEFRNFLSDQHVAVNAVRFKSKCECRDRHILLNYACTEFNEIRSVVLSCYVETDRQTDTKTQESYKMRLRNVRFRWKV